METVVRRGDASAMAANTALNMALTSVVPASDRAEFEKFFRSRIRTQVKQMYAVWEYNRAYQKAHGNKHG